MSRKQSKSERHKETKYYRRQTERKFKSEETTQNENIREGEAKDDNDLTGTYVDEESGETLKVVVKDGKASFCLYSKDGEDILILKKRIGT